ncbi:MAG TPA: Rrf2 family transcriptional regulator [Bacteroidales bacterium]|nr:Rrf2 family transcriptional regulator [Bacteroidales bacterium]HPT01864.1 Rrf2 family transcriptional regulator [Bacteroidales bacterium]
MAKIVTYSEAASIGMHGMVLIARAGEIMNIQKITEITGSSKHHVAKVMQRLVKDGLLISNRGPQGGFMLNEEPKNITLLRIYESIEGEVKILECPHEKPVCPFGKCILGNVVPQMTTLFRDQLASTTLFDLL